VTHLVLVVLTVVVVGLVVAFLLRRRFLLSGLGYRALSLSVRPNERLVRSELEVESRRVPERDDPALPDGVVLRCRTGAGPRELAMDASTVTGFLSWVESAPPVR
jgi:hypothetical protein